MHFRRKILGSAVSAIDEKTLRPCVRRVLGEGDGCNPPTFVTRGGPASPAELLAWCPSRSRRGPASREVP